jgi:alkanesulfonate monooxygenase SsuD/methylene tetrahydromethanopterin reductase-like flavin-dependent oxidoreductase (luciferase family)
VAAQLQPDVRLAERPALTWPKPPLGEVRLGVVILPEHDGPQGPAIWQRAEQVGFAHAWTFDHLIWRGLPDGPWFDALTTLAAAAAVTREIGLGPLVATPNLRHPVMLARQVMTLDHISGGRLVLGLGAGAEGPDSTILGGPALSVSERAARFREFTELTDRLLRQRRTTHRGRFFAAADVPMAPGCVQQPRVPLAIAAPGPRGMRLAAQHADIWVCNVPAGDPGSLSESEAFAAIADQIGRLAEACAAARRDFAALPKLVYLSRFLPGLCESADRITDGLARCAAMGCTDVAIAYPRPAGPLAGRPAVLEEVAADLASRCTPGTVPSFASKHSGVPRGAQERRPHS